MNVEDLNRLFDYSYWANQKLMETVCQLEADQYTEPLPLGKGCVRDTMVHMLSAEWGWLDRCGGPKRGAPLNPADYPAPGALIERWGQVEGHMRNFLAGLHDSDLARPIEFAIGGTEKRCMPLGDLLYHAANHGIHHRGQVSLRLRQLGYNPANFDILYYYAEKGRPGAAC
jgi:uncharacterized damage-inducible protein DinB